MWPNRRGRRGGHADVYAYMMAIQTAIQFMQQHRTPLVTLALILANVLVYLRPGPLDEVLPGTKDVCLNPALFLRTMNWRRLILSAFFHADDTHLIYNMISLLWKGMELEGQMGSTRFAATTAALLVLSHGLLVVVSKTLSKYVGFHEPFYQECAIGFSSVLFGFKTLLNAHQPTYTNVGGMMLPTKYAAWGELLLIQMIVPNASFTGHLCGILAGLLLLYTPTSAASVFSILSLRPLLRYPSRLFRPRFFGSGQSGYRQANQAAQRQQEAGWDPRSRDPTWERGESSSRRGADEGQGLQGRPRAEPDRRGKRVVEEQPFWTCPTCTFHNTLHSDICEMCGSSPEILGAKPEPAELLHSRAPLPQDWVPSTRQEASPVPSAPPAALDGWIVDSTDELQGSTEVGGWQATAGEAGLRRRSTRADEGPSVRDGQRPSVEELRHLRMARFQGEG